MPNASLRLFATLLTAGSFAVTSAGATNNTSHVVAQGKADSIDLPHLHLDQHVVETFFANLVQHAAALSSAERDALQLLHAALKLSPPIAAIEPHHHHQFFEPINEQPSEQLELLLSSQHQPAPAAPITPDNHGQPPTDHGGSEARDHAATSPAGSHGHARPPDAAPSPIPPTDATGSVPSPLQTADTAPLVYLMSKDKFNHLIAIIFLIICYIAVLYHDPPWPTASASEPSTSQPPAVPSLLLGSYPVTTAAGAGALAALLAAKLLWAVRGG